MKENRGIMLITGGSRGIGAATAYKAAEKGYSVCINYRRDNKSAEKVVADITRLGCHAIAVQADVSREQEVENLFNLVDSEFGKLSCLVNNAGILHPQSRLVDMGTKRIVDLFENNLLSYFLCCREAVKRLSTKNNGNGGAIVNVSSIASLTGSPGEYIDYASLKGAVDTLTIGLSKEVASQGIRVNAVRPGLIDTSIHAAGGEPNRLERYRDAIPLKRGGTTDEVADAIMWLLSEQSSFVTGSFIDVAGGIR